MYAYSLARDAPVPIGPEARLRRWCGIGALASWVAITITALTQIDTRLRMNPDLRLGVFVWLVTCAAPSTITYWLVPVAQNFLALTRAALQNGTLSDEYITAYHRRPAARRSVATALGHAATLAYGCGALIDIGIATHQCSLSGINLDITMLLVLCIGKIGSVVGIIGPIMADAADIMELAADKRTTAPGQRTPNVIPLRQRRTRWAIAHLRAADTSAGEREDA
jgi:hypothetical protein